jgi:hypothetical protein
MNGELLFYAAAVIIEYEGTRWMDALSIESESQRAHDLTLLLLTPWMYHKFSHLRHQNSGFFFLV